MLSKTTMKHQSYNDGVLKYYSVTPTFDKSRRKTGDEKKFIGFYMFELCTKRQQDLEFAESHSKKLDLKIKIPKNSFDLDYLVEINNDFYECYQFDDSDDFSIYLYLQKVKI